MGPSSLRADLPSTDYSQHYSQLRSIRDLQRRSKQRPPANNMAHPLCLTANHLIGLLSFIWLWSWLIAVVMADQTEIGCGGHTASLATVDAAATCASPGDSTLRTFEVGIKGTDTNPGGADEYFTGAINQSPKTYKATKEPSPCPAVCTSQPELQTVPPHTQCYAWTHWENANTANAFAWRFYGYEIAAQADNHGPRIIVCKFACVGYDYAYC